MKGSHLLKPRDMDNFGSLYNCVYNAGFWKKIGLNNKRASKTIEDDERVHLEKYIEDISDEIVERRKSACKYMKKYYGKRISELNEKDKLETSVQISQDRRTKRDKELREEIINDFLRSKNPWVDDVGYEDPESPKVALSKRSDNILDTIRNICAKYPDEECSKQIVQYLDDIKL